MKVYFTASVSGKAKYVDEYLHIVNVLKELKCVVTYEHILDSSEEGIKILPREERIKFHDSVVHWIHDCDFVVADTSYPSTSAGYEIAIALRVGKPVLVLYSEGDPPSLLGLHKDDKLICEKYDKHTLKNIIEDFVSYVSERHDMRFTFFITPRIMSYLDLISKQKKVPKSVYLRNLIEEDIQKNNI